MIEIRMEVKYIYIFVCKKQRKSKNCVYLCASNKDVR